MSEHDEETGRAGFTRREMVAAMAAVTAGALIRPTEAQAAEAMRISRHRAARSATTRGFEPKVYTEHEWQTVRMLVDYLIPKDEHSGSATDAMVPEFMDTMLDLEPGMRTAHRGGLAWLDHESRERFGVNFVTATDPQRRQILDDIAWPDKASDEFKAGVEWFNHFRDFTASGFWTSEIGVADIGYQGNTPRPHWTGCPPESLKRLGF